MWNIGQPDVAVYKVSQAEKSAQAGDDSGDTAGCLLSRKFLFGGGFFL